MMICVYVDGVPAPLTADLQVVAESLLCRPFPDLSLRGNRFVESTDDGAAGRPCGDRPPLRIAPTAACGLFTLGEDSALRHISRDSCD